MSAPMFVLRAVLGALCISAGTLAGCGGGGGGTGGDGGMAPPPTSTPAARVTFDDTQTRTVLPAGSATFTVSPALSANEQVVCTLDGAAASPCKTSDGSGEIRYENLSTGSHQLLVEIRGADGAVTSRSRTLELTTARVIVFGATPGGITAAIAAARAGQTVAILEPTRWVGGMMSGGLSKTDIGWRGAEVIGGLASEFFDKVRAAETARGACPGSCTFDFEPQVAERVFEDMLRAAQVIVERSASLASVQKDAARITTLTTSRGTVEGEVFIDASYEGDLMAMAGVPFRVGREARVLADPADDPAQLAMQEDDAGVLQYRVPRGGVVDPYRVPGDPTSGTLPYIEPRPSFIRGAGTPDSRVMAYTYRLCVTDDPSNRIPFERPENYDPAQFEASGRLSDQWVAQTGVDLAVTMFNPERVALSKDHSYSKYDLNGGSTFSIDMTAPDLNQSYVEADEATRERIREAYRAYIRGLLYFWQTDPRLRGLNQKIARFGLCKDEFVDRGGWPHQLYVREARRMVGEYVMNENDVLQNGRRPPISDPIGFGAYNIDVHTVRYFAAPVNWPDGTRREAIVNEGFLTLRQPNDAPYPVSYRALTPRAADATNLLDPVTLSATHIAYSALRMEPTYMILGQAAGTAAALAVETHQTVQSINYSTLRERLQAAGQHLP